MKSGARKKTTPRAVVAAMPQVKKGSVEDDPRFQALTGPQKALLTFPGLPANTQELLLRCKSFEVVGKDEVWQIATAPGERYSIHIDVSGMTVVEAEATKSATGLALTFNDELIRKRDSGSMTIAIVPGQKPKTDKPLFHKRFGYDFEKLEGETYDELAQQELIVVPFKAGGKFPAFIVMERKWAALAWQLCKLQPVCSLEELGKCGKCHGIGYICPKFRHTKFERKQIVVHRDNGEVHEFFAFHPYPGPSLKKGVYTMLLAICEKLGQPVYHASAVVCTAQNGNRTVHMHSGASGGGKSEMLQQLRRLPDGSVIIARNLITGDQITGTIGITAILRALADDMVFAWVENGVLYIYDAEHGWFLRVDNILKYGDEPELEALCSRLGARLAFLNIHTVPGEVTQLWRHHVDLSGRRSANPRASEERSQIPGIVNEPQVANFMSFGIRTPPTFNPEFLAQFNQIQEKAGKKPIGMGYGHLGLMQMLPPSLAWLWMIAAPRGFDNPSISNAGDGLTTEGVGTFGAFNSGREVFQANLIWRQIEQCPGLRYPLYPVKNIGAWSVGNVPQQIGREFLSRMGSNQFKAEQIAPAKDPLLGYRIRTLDLDGISIPRHLLNTVHQQELGEDGYLASQAMLTDFFKSRAQELLRKRRELDKGPRRVLQICLDGGSVADYDSVLHPGREFKH